MEFIIGLGIILVSIMVAIILHELAHGYVAKYLGDTTAEEEGRLTLNPLSHIDPIFTLALPIILAITGAPVLGAAKPVPVQGHRLKGEEFGMALVAVVGPLTNLILAMVGAVLMRFFSESQILDSALEIFIQVNIGFFLFNLIPIPPLDGSRVLYAFSPEPLQGLLARIEPFGFMIIFALLLLGMPLIGPIFDNLYSFITTYLGVAK